MGDAFSGAQRPWQSYINNIQHLVIGSGITYIGNYIFYNHTALQDVTFEAESTLGSIGTNAFQNCTSLTSVTLPEGLTTIKNYAFNNTGLTSATIPSTVTNIYYHSFDNCTSLTSVVMNVIDPATLTLQSTSFQSGVTVYVSDVDAWNTKFPNATYHCIFTEKVPDVWTSGDTNLVYTSGTMTISKKADEGNGAMGDYDYLPLPWSARLDDIETIIIEDGVTHIGNYAFANCPNLSSVTLPDGLTSIGNSTFNNTGLTSVTIPSSVTAIGNSAFVDCTSLSSVTLPDGLTSIDNSAFANTGLTSVTIPSSVTAIGNSAFAECANLSSLTLTKGLTTIGEFAFDHTGLTSVTIPSSVTTINSAAFQFCESLSSITIYAPSLTDYYYDVFAIYASGFNIYVLSDCINTYKTGWSSYASIIKPIPDPAALTTASVEDANWSTYYNSNANVQVDDNTTVYKVALDGSSITLTDTGSKIIKAGEAVVLSTTTSGITLAYTSTASTGDYTDNSLLGSNEVVTQESGYTYYALANLTKGLGFYKVSSSISIPAHKAYLRVATGESRDFYGIDEETTSLSGEFRVESGEFATAEGYYDLSGRRVEHPTKGLYIVNGKKVVLKH